MKQLASLIHEKRFIRMKEIIQREKMNRCEVMFCNMIAVFGKKNVPIIKAKNDEKLDKYPNIIN